MQAQLSPLPPAQSKKQRAERRAFKRKWSKYRFATDEDCERLSLPPSYFGLLINKDGTLPDDFSYGPENKYHIPRKLRRNELAVFAAGIVDEWLELPRSDREYFGRFFWRDLRLRGIQVPGPIADLGF